MKYILLVVLLLITGCDTFENKINEMNRLSCQPVHSMCEPNESLLICDSEDKRECQGWIL